MCVGSGSKDAEFGSGFIITRYGSGSFYHQAKIVRKLFLALLWLFIFEKNYVNVASKRNKQKKLRKRITYGYGSVELEKKNNLRIRIRGTGSVPKCHRSAKLQGGKKWPPEKSFSLYGTLCTYPTYSKLCRRKKSWKSLDFLRDVLNILQVSENICWNRASTVPVFLWRSKIYKKCGYNCILPQALLLS